MTRKPFLKWAGGECRLLDRILYELPAARRYVEPFSGSAAVYLNTAAPDAIVNDMNADLVALYMRIQQEGETFIRYASRFFTAANRKRLFIDCGTRSTPQMTPELSHLRCNASSVARGTCERKRPNFWQSITE